MSLFEISAVLIVVTALFSFVNHKLLRLPPTIGVMVIALLLSLGLIGLEVLVMPFTPHYLLAGLITIPIVLLARGVSVWGAVNLLRWRRTFTPGAVPIMTWCGLKGGISVALALSLPAGPERPAILAVTYAVVVFSIVVQGLTVPAFVRRTLSKASNQ